MPIVRKFISVKNSKCKNSESWNFFLNKKKFQNLRNWKISKLWISKFPKFENLEVENTNILQYENSSVWKTQNVKTQIVENFFKIKKNFRICVIWKL